MEIEKIKAEIIAEYGGIAPIPEKNDESEGLSMFKRAALDKFDFHEKKISITYGGVYGFTFNESSEDCPEFVKTFISECRSWIAKR